MHLSYYLSNKTNNLYFSLLGDCFGNDKAEHPMDEDHYIAMIELIADGQIHKQYLNPGDKPEAYFQIPEAECVEAREFCTLAYNSCAALYPIFFCL